MSDKDNALPSHMGRYEIVELLGRGGMGRVFAAQDPKLRRKVAVKILEPDLGPGPELDEIRFLFHREARATAALKHPSIVQIFDYSGPDSDTLFLACELIDGPTLRNVLDERGPTPTHTAVAIAYELAGALSAAHEAGVVHRDVKPENVFWTREGRIVLGDFGIAKALDGGAWLGDTAINAAAGAATKLYGSPCFMAPERIEGRQASPSSDIFSLGALLYECLTGEAAFSGDTVDKILDAVLRGPPADLTSPQSLPPNLSQLLKGMLARQPEGRPTSASQVAESLREILDGLSISDPRLCLRDFGSESDENDERPMFAEVPLQGILIPRNKSTWSKVAQRGPVALGMLGFAIALGAGVHLFREVSDASLPANPPAQGIAPVPSPTVSTTPGAPPNTGDGEDVFVLLQLGGDDLVTVSIDGTVVGTWSKRVRLALPPGKHQVVATSAGGEVSKEIMLLTDTSPTFDLTSEHRP